jgi:hypothetical protein
VALLSWLPAGVFDVVEVLHQPPRVLRMVIAAAARAGDDLSRGYGQQREFRGFVPRRDKEAHRPGLIGKDGTAHGVADSE